jgi:hypothetical protein
MSTRDEAAMLLAIAASNDAHGAALIDASNGVDASDAAYILADTASMAATGATWAEVYAEAEALLRTGWTP